MYSGICRDETPRFFLRSTGRLVASFARIAAPPHDTLTLLITGPPPPTSRPNRSLLSYLRRLVTLFRKSQWWEWGVGQAISIFLRYGAKMRRPTVAAKMSQCGRRWLSGAMRRAAMATNSIRAVNAPMSHPRITMCFFTSPSISLCLYSLYSVVSIRSIFSIFSISPMISVFHISPNLHTFRIYTTNEPK